MPEQPTKLHVWRTAYVCFLVVYMAVREVTPLQFLIRSSLVSGAVFLLGFGILLWDVLSSRVCFKTRGIYCLLAFLAICTVSSIWHYRYGISSNVKALGALVLEYMVLYPAALEATPLQRRKDVASVAITLSVVWDMFTIVSCGMYIHDIEYTVLERTQGFSAQYMRLWGVFQDPNYAGCISLITIYAAIYLITCTRRKWVYVWGGVHIALQLSYIVLGGSRAVLLLLLTSVGIWSMYVLYRRWQTVRAVLLSAACVCLAFATVVGMQFALPLAKRVIRPILPQSAVSAFYDGLYAATDAQRVQHETDIAEQTIDAIHRTDTETEDVSNGRFTRWKDTVTIFLQSPIIGVSPRNVAAFAKQHAPDTLMATDGVAPHSGYLDVLVGSGIAGTAVLFSFLVYVLYLILRRMRNEKDVKLFSFTAVTVFLLAGSAVFVSDVFLYFTQGAVLFWWLLGYTVHENAI